MKIVQINTFPYKATGNIMMGIHNLLVKNGYDSYVVWGRGRGSENSHEIVIADRIGVNFHGIYTRLTDKTGFASWNATRQLLRKLDEIEPDVIHLHNLHGYYINIEMLFHYIKSNGIKVVWTLHDCWALTGHCAYFDMIGCEKWKTGCYRCEQKHTYPSTRLLDSSRENWIRKKKLFSDLDAVIVTPCRWLQNKVTESILKDYPVQVIYNGVDLAKFKPYSKEEIRMKYSPENKPIVLGVASEWTERKGLIDFIKLSGNMKDVQVVVVGLSEDQIKTLPAEIRGIRRTSNLQELVELYSTADVFFNPTYEDNFPTTNLEALACGTPFITYDTGGSSETIKIAENHGIHNIGISISKISRNKADMTIVEKNIRSMMVKSSNVSKNCRKAAELFDQNIRFEEYINLYQTLK